MAFYNEYNIDKNQLSPNSNSVSLAKWKSNTNISVRFGKSVGKKQKEKDIQEINDLIKNLSDITDHKIEISQQNENMYSLLLTEKKLRI